MQAQQATDDGLQPPDDGGAGRVLAIFSSFTPVAKGGDNVKVQLDSSALGLRSGANATDAITQEVIPLSGGVLSFWLNAHDFRMITIV